MTKALGAIYTLNHDFQNKWEKSLIEEYLGIACNMKKTIFFSEDMKKYIYMFPGDKTKQ